ncbi:type IV pilin [Natrarchaeobius halalkaliphilus]|uniref:Type IV pilin n=1 Tax=Natrarchaeobius halalkaliphilus TaxID=1679091 RepID=A0A3N6NUX4_9EURY|nr:type IV pilin N-terminal domain-containing protein [Natrarchaeobius halalkaliphilus]RQG87040.1 type IV pilin [Natrarchaeobius halalkaliphilus]
MTSHSLQYRNRAVSPVIGVILVVAITVILAAVVAGLVLDIGSDIDEEVQAGVSITVQHDPQYLDVQVTTLGNADHINITGDPYDNLDDSSPNNLDEDDLRELETGDSVRIGKDDLESAGENGTVVAVGVAGEQETLITSEDYNFS